MKLTRGEIDGLEIKPCEDAARRILASKEQDQIEKSKAMKIGKRQEVLASMIGTHTTTFDPPDTPQPTEKKENET